MKSTISFIVVALFFGCVIAISRAENGHGSGGSHNHKHPEEKTDSKKEVKTDSKEEVKTDSKKEARPTIKDEGSVAANETTGAQDKAPEKVSEKSAGLLSEDSADHHYPSTICAPNCVMSETGNSHPKGHAQNVNPAPDDGDHHQPIYNGHSEYGYGSHSEYDYGHRGHDPHYYHPEHGHGGYYGHHRWD